MESMCLSLNTIPVGIGMKYAQFPASHTMPSRVNYRNILYSGDYPATGSPETSPDAGQEVI
jgi:hypothetical protein